MLVIIWCIGIVLTILFFMGAYIDYNYTEEDEEQIKYLSEKRGK